MRRPTAIAIAALAALTFNVAGANLAAAQGELNLYSSRHYDTDERLYSDFEEATGIEINRIEDNANVLIERMKSEGDNSPADVLLTTDAGVLWQAEQAGLFQPVESDVLESEIPAKLRHPDGLWFGFSKRARVIFYDKERVDPTEIASYQDLADPEWEGMVCARSSSNIYMLSLMASLIEHLGQDAAQDWAEGLRANLAREPEGGDTDQLRAIVSGQCAIAIGNTYYFARALRKDVEGLANPEDTGRIGVIFPNQDSWGTHVNISGGGVAAHAPNRKNAVKFLEYLVSRQAQEYFANGNDEYPVVDDVAAASNVQSLGDFNEDDLDLTALGRNQAAAQLTYDAVGYR